MVPKCMHVSNNVRTGQIRVWWSPLIRSPATPMSPPANLNLSRAKLNQKHSGTALPGGTSRVESVLTTTEEGAYQPKTKETRALGGQPLNIVSAAADEILAVLKNDAIKNPDKKEIEKLLNPITSHVFDHLVSIGRLITDYQDGGDAAATTATNCSDALDDKVGVAVELEENEDERDLDMVQEDEEEEDKDDVVQPNGTGAM
ncbi:DExH-box ATP-dependent RNA helicase DExH12 [Ancistrocladus abbreviatus]